MQYRPMNLKNDLMKKHSYRVFFYDLIFQWNEQSPRVIRHLVEYKKAITISLHV